MHSEARYLYILRVKREFTFVAEEKRKRAVLAEIDNGRRNVAHKQHVENIMWINDAAQTLTKPGLT